MTDLAADREVTIDAEATAPRVRGVRMPLLTLRDATGTLAECEPRSNAPALMRDASAVHGIDLDVRPREIVGVLGESGAGDVALMRLAAGLRPLERGHRWWRGRDVTHVASRDARAARLRIQPILGGRLAALNPRFRVVDAVGDAPVGGRIIGPGQKVEYVALQLNRVGIDPMLMHRFPQQFTPGQRVRIGIARALAVRPEMLVWDDVFGGIDATERAQLVNLALDLRSAHELTYLLACRDPAIVAHASDRVVVLYRGRVVESGRPAMSFAHRRIRTRVTFSLRQAMRGSAAQPWKRPARWRVEAAGAPSARGARTRCRAALRSHRCSSRSLPGDTRHATSTAPLDVVLTPGGTGQAT